MQFSARIESMKHRLSRGLVVIALIILVLAFRLNS